MFSLGQDLRFSLRHSGIATLVVLLPCWRWPLCFPRGARHRLTPWRPSATNSETRKTGGKRRCGSAILREEKGQAWETGAICALARSAATMPACNRNAANDARHTP